jgi:hypothetical protein
MDPWLFLPIGYVFTIFVETPVLMLLLSSRHSLNTRLVAGIWLSACTYPVVVLVLPQVFDIANDRLTYLLVAETFAPLAECALFWLAFGKREEFGRWSWWQDMIAIVVANLASFGLGELIYASGAFEWLRDQLGY